MQGKALLLICRKLDTETLINRVIIRIVPLELSIKSR